MWHLHYGDTPQDYHRFQEVGHTFGNAMYVKIANHSTAHILESKLILWALLVKEYHCAREAKMEKR
jgi:hypothetical protein